MDTPRPNVLILAARAEDAGRWSAALGPAASCLWTSREQVPEGARIDLVVADGQDAVWLAAGPADSPAPGVIRVGAAAEPPADAPPADVHLPADATERELRLAAELLARLVSLRRRLTAGTALQHGLAIAALTDPLTGLPNRRAWERMLALRLADRAAGLHLCVAILDLDHFKQVNDTLGHAAGDAVLRAAGQTLLAGLRESDFVARLGGDEFGLLLAVHEPSDATAAIERVRVAIGAGTARVGEPVTASAGLCVSPPTAADPDAVDRLYGAADAALREAKAQGRNRTVHSNP